MLFKVSGPEERQIGVLFALTQASVFLMLVFRSDCCQSSHVGPRCVGEDVLTEEGRVTCPAAPTDAEMFLNACRETRNLKTSSGQDGTLVKNVGFNLAEVEVLLGPELVVPVLRLLPQVSQPLFQLRLLLRDAVDDRPQVGQRVRGADPVMCRAGLRSQRCPLKNGNMNNN